MERIVRIELTYGRFAVCAITQPGLSAYGRGDADRTRNTRFWRPLLFQLSYTPMVQEAIPALVRSGGLEPAALSIKSRLLYHLSYERLLRICRALLVGHD